MTEETAMANYDDIDTETFELDKSANGQTETVRFEFRATSTGPVLDAHTDEATVLVTEITDTKVLFSRRISLCGHDDVGGLKIPAEIRDALRAEKDRLTEEIEQVNEAERETPLSFDVVRKSYRISDYQTSALVLSPSKETRLWTDEETEQVEVLREVLGEKGNHHSKQLAAPDGVEEGDTLAVEDVFAMTEGAEEELAAAREEKAATARAEQERADRKATFDMEVQNRRESGSGEGHAIHATVRLTDAETGETVRYRLRNAVDIGFQIFAVDGEDPDEDLDSRAREHLREFSPIPRGIRMSESDRGY